MIDAKDAWEWTSCVRRRTPDFKPPESGVFIEDSMAQWLCSPVLLDFDWLTRDWKKLSAARGLPWEKNSWDRQVLQELERECARRVAYAAARGKAHLLWEDALPDGSEGRSTLCLASVLGFLQTLGYRFVEQALVREHYYSRFLLLFSWGPEPVRLKSRSRRMVLG